MRNGRALIGLAITLVLVACAAPSQTQGPRSEAEATRPASAKRITAAISGDAFTFYNKLNLGNGVVRQILLLAADDLPIMNVHFTVRPTLIHDRIVNVGAAAPRSTNGWNAEQWEVR